MRFSLLILLLYFFFVYHGGQTSHQFLFHILLFAFRSSQYYALALFSAFDFPNPIHFFPILSCYKRVYCFTLSWLSNACFSTGIRGKSYLLQHTSKAKFCHRLLKTKTWWRCIVGLLLRIDVFWEYVLTINGEENEPLSPPPLQSFWILKESRKKKTRYISWKL